MQAMVADAARPAGFWQRYAAWSLDAAIVAVPVLLLTADDISSRAKALPAAFMPALHLMAQRLTDTLMEGGDPMQLPYQLAAEPQLRLAMEATFAQLNALLAMPMLWFAAFAAIYWIGFEASRWQATPGKRAMHLRTMVLADPGLGWRRAALRHVAGALSWLTLNLGHALAAWTPQKRALHDFVAGTRVIAVDGNARLPAWAKAWLLLQAVAALWSSAWLYLSLLNALQTAVDSSLY